MASSGPASAATSRNCYRDGAWKVRSIEIRCGTTAAATSGPAVSSEETESHTDAVEVKVTWGSQVLSLSHLEGDKGFSIGEGGDFDAG